MTWIARQRRSLRYLTSARGRGFAAVPDAGPAPRGLHFPSGCAWPGAVARPDWWRFPAC